MLNVDALLFASHIDASSLAPYLDAWFFTLHRDARFVSLHLDTVALAYMRIPVLALHLDACSFASYLMN